MKVHDLKCWPQYFREVKSGDKTFEWRFSGDRKFRTGDVILQREYDIRLGEYSGEVTIHGAGYILTVGDHDAISLLAPTHQQISAAMKHDKEWLARRPAARRGKPDAR